MMVKCELHASLKCDGYDGLMRDLIWLRGKRILWKDHTIIHTTYINEAVCEINQ